MLKNLVILLVFGVSLCTSLKGQSAEGLSLLFVGDIMGHDTQIDAAKAESKTGGYNYDSCFHFVSPLFKSVDYTIANLELTFAGPPYKGYPQFSSPESLGGTLKKAGVHGIAMANNHVADGGTRGLKRTIGVLDSLNFKRTGAFLNITDRLQTMPLVVEKNGIKLGILNYTYGTNGLSVSAPTSVNYIDSVLIESDIRAARKVCDELVVFFHWGKEYKHEPNTYQKGYVNYCKSLGIRYVVGSHPHVLQPFVWNSKGAEDELFVAYSLGNFVSNQRTQPRDGGAVLRLDFEKDSCGKVNLSSAGYHLTWVYTPTVNGQRMFYIMPLAEVENDKNLISDPFQFNKMKSFASKMRELMKLKNKNVPELKSY